MFTIYICDDQTETLHYYQSIVEQHIQIENMDVASVIAVSSPIDLISIMRSYSFIPAGLYFLDIDLNHEMNGIRLAEKIREFDPRGFIVFITAHEHYRFPVTDSDIETLRFITKNPANRIESQIFQCINIAFSRYSSASNITQKTFHFVTRDKHYVFEYHDVIFFRTIAQHKIEIITLNSRHSFTSDISKIYKSLDKRVFFQCHTSFIINLDHIKEFDVTANELIMAQGYQLPVAIRRKKMLHSLLKDRNSNIR